MDHLPAPDTLTDLRQGTKLAGNGYARCGAEKNLEKPLDRFGVVAHSNHMTTKQKATRPYRTITGALVAGLIALTGCASTPTGMDKFRSDWAKGSADTRDVICDGVREYGATWSANLAADAYPKVPVTQLASFLNEVC